MDGNSRMRQKRMICVVGKVKKTHRQEGTVILDPSLSAEEVTDWQESYVVSRSSTVKEAVFPETDAAVARRMDVVTLVFSP